MTSKKSFVLPCDCLDDLEDFTTVETGELFLAVLKYVNTGEEPCFCDRAMKMYFRRIKNYIDSANESYEKTIQARSEAGKKSARKRSTNSTNVNFVEQKATNSTDTDTDTESDIDTESVLKESDREKTRSPTRKYGENGNVMLTIDEYERLAEQMGVSKRDEYIDKLGDYMASSGKEYHSHYATIRNWFRRDGGKKVEAPSYDMGEYSSRGEALPVYSKEGD